MKDSVELSETSYSFGYEALSSSHSIENISEGEFTYIKKDSVVLVPGEDEDEFIPVICSAHPVPEYCDDWIGISRVGENDYILALHHIDALRDLRIRDRSDISTTQKPVVPSAYAMPDMESEDDNSAILYGDDEAKAQLEKLMDFIDGENEALQETERQQKQKQERNKQIRKVGRGILTVTSIVPIPQPFGAGVNLVASAVVGVVAAVFASDD